MRIQFEDMLRNYQAQMNAAIDECLQQKIPIRKVAEGFTRFAVNIRFVAYLNKISTAGVKLIEKMTEDEIKAHQRGIADGITASIGKMLDEIVDNLTNENLRRGDPDPEDSKT